MTLICKLSSESNLCNGFESKDKAALDNPACEGNFTLNNCDDVHIGPHYENSNNIIINQNISEPHDKELLENVQLTLRQELQNTSLKGFRQYSKLIYVVIAIIIIATIILWSVVIYVMLNSNKETEKTKLWGVIPTELQDSEDYPINLQFVSRQSWGASQPINPLMNNTLPVQRVIFIHTVNSGTCNNYAACAYVVKNIQDFHVERGCDDIGYNFVVGSDGYIYVGLGWDKVGCHSKGFNNGSLGVAFVGDFRTDIPNEKLISSVKRLLKFGVEREKLAENYQVFGHCQVMRGFPYSPGINILNAIKGWDHWNGTHAENCAGFKM